MRGGFARQAALGALALTLALTALLGAPAAAQEDTGPEVDRIAGQERFQTAAALALAAFPDGAGIAFVATAADFPDALAAGPVAAALGGPVLLVRQAEIPQATADALEDLGVRRVFLLGGGRAIGGGVEEQLGGMVEDVRRLSGTTRYETAAAVARRMPGPVPVVYLASGESFPDALTGGASGAATGGPVLLIEPTAVPRATIDALRDLDPEEIRVLGGEAVVAAGMVQEIRDLTGLPVRRVSGTDRHATSAAVSRDTYPNGAAEAFLATGRDFPDALAASPLAGLRGAPLLLSDRDCVPVSVLDELDRLGVERVVLVGGTKVLARGAARLMPCGRVVDVVEDRLSVPWDVAFTPDGRTFVSERDTGRLLELGSGRPTVRRVFPVDPAGEGGLLGLATSPNYAEDGLLYAYYTTGHDNRVVRFDPDGGPETVVVNGIPRSTIHNGGRMTFAPDGRLLYIGTGDAGDPSRSRDWDSLGGKVLRVRPDGSVPSGNPIWGSPVWARGFRNVQGLAFSGQTLFASDLGPGCDDEINVVRPGADYGWPEDCGVTRPGAEAPLVVRQPAEASWSGIAVLSDGALPTWEGDLFAAALRGQRLWRFSFGDGDAEALYVGDFGRLRHVAQAPDGSLWLLTSNRDGRGTPTADDDRIIRIAPPPR